MIIKTNAGYIFDQLSSLLEQLTDDQYCLSLEIFSGATMGKHYRHIIEFFQSVSVAGQTEAICYDNRIRDTRIENNRSIAIRLLHELKEELSEIDSAKTLTLIGDLGTSESGVPSYIGTSLYREFHYAVEHAIHHMAIIKMGVKQAFPAISIDGNFGVAPSTIRYQQEVAAKS